MSTARITSLGPLRFGAGPLHADSVKASGIDQLKSALRRSALLIVGIVVLGILSVNLVRQVGGPQYESKARVILTGTNMSAALLGINPVYEDPARQDQAEQNLVNSPQLYAYASQRARGRAGTAADLMRNVSATVSNNVVDFSATASRRDSAIASVTAVTDAYPHWRAKVSSDAINAGITQIQSQIARFGTTPALVRQLQQLQALKNLSSSDTLFVEPAAGATKTTPRPVKDSLLGALLGLVVALLIVGARELFDTTVRSEAEVEDALEVPVLATIETIPRRLRVSAVDGGGRVGDEYDLLAANIAHIFEGHEGTVQLAITSALSGEGKTTTATNVAAALARRGTNVLLADFDLRKPSVAEYFGIPEEAAGVTELLAGSIQLRSAMWRVPLNGERSEVDGARAVKLGARTPKTMAQRAGVAGGSLTVMPGGSAPSNRRPPSFVQLPSLLQRFPAEADFVVIDTPPALLIAGMAELAQTVDAVIVVVRHGQVNRRRLRALGRQARSWRARLLGAVLNDGPIEEGYAGYYGRNYSANA